MTECTSIVQRLEVWRNDAVSKLVEALATATTCYRDDLCRVGERLIAVARGSKCLNDSDDDEVGRRLQEARSKLPTFEESRDDFRERQAKLDSTARSKGALVFPAMDVEKFAENARSVAKVNDLPKMPTEQHSRDAVDVACGAIPTMPPSKLVAKKGVLEYERNVMGAATLGWSYVFVIVTFDGFLSAYPGRTEGAVEHEAPAFRCDLTLAQVLDEDDEGPVITIATKPKSNLAAFVVGDRHFRLRCRNAAEKFAWFKCLNDPLATYDDDEISNEGSPPETPVAPSTPSSSSDLPTTFV